MKKPKISKKTLKQDIYNASHIMKDTTKINQKLDKLYDYIEYLENKNKEIK